LYGRFFLFNGMVKPSLICIKGNWMIVLTIAMMCMASCNDPQEQLDEREVYEGPFIEIEDSEVLYSDSAIVRLMVRAARMQEYESGDQEYPEGIYVEFYGKDREMTSKLEADQAFYSKETDEYRAVGNVKLESIQKHQKLTTEELFWNRKDKQVYTDKFVIIETGEDVLHGQGLTAAQDFSTYRILKPTGELGLD
jgi:LPS export ABC transporter protein LptC